MSEQRALAGLTAKTNCLVLVKTQPESQGKWSFSLCHVHGYTESTRPSLGLSEEINALQTCWKTLWSVELYKDILRKLILSNLRKRRLNPDQTVALMHINYGHKEKKPEFPQRCATKAHGNKHKLHLEKSGVCIMKYLKIMKTLNKRALECWKICPWQKCFYGISVLGDFSNLNWRRPLPTWFNLGTDVGPNETWGSASGPLPWLSDRGTYKYGCIN